MPPHEAFEQHANYLIEIEKNFPREIDAGQNRITGLQYMVTITLIDVVRCQMKQLQHVSLKQTACVASC